MINLSAISLFKMNISGPARPWGKFGIYCNCSLHHLIFYCLLSLTDETVDKTKNIITLNPERGSFFSCFYVSSECTSAVALNFLFAILMTKTGHRLIEKCLHFNGKSITITQRKFQNMI